jgi:hypothetical protein
MWRTQASNCGIRKKNEAKILTMEQDHHDQIGY